MKECKAGEYIFSHNLSPGPVQINARQITKRWRIHVKQPSGITVDFYTFKSMNVTEVMDELSDYYKKAAEETRKLTSHTTNQMIERIYDLKNKERKDDAIKSVGNGII